MCCSRWPSAGTPGCSFSTSPQLGWTWKAGARYGHASGLRGPWRQRAAWTEADPLTDRERQVLRFAGDGATGAEIAKRLKLPEGTVRNHLSEAISKLGASNRTEAARIA